MRVAVSAEASEGIPGLTVRVHRPSQSFTDLTFSDTVDARVAL
jgi:hypothetical protein